MIKPTNPQIAEINRLIRSRTGTGDKADIARISVDALTSRLAFVVAGAYGEPAAAWAKALHAHTNPTTNAAWGLIGVNLLILIGILESTSAPRHIEDHINATIRDRFAVGLQTQIAFDNLQRTREGGVG